MKEQPYAEAGCQARVGAASGANRPHAAAMTAGTQRTLKKKVVGYCFDCTCDELWPVLRSKVYCVHLYTYVYLNLSRACYC